MARARSATRVGPRAGAAENKPSNTVQPGSNLGLKYNKEQRGNKYIKIALCDPEIPKPTRGSALDTTNKPKPTWGEEKRNPLLLSQGIHRGSRVSESR